MKLRKITSLTLLFSFILLLITSVILYIVPHGRIAYWSHWTMWGLTKTEWANLHVNLGILFIIMIIIHTVLNWRSIVSYLKNGEISFYIFNSNFLIALALVILFSVGTYFSCSPFNWFINISESIKDNATEKYGEPPYGHAELSTLEDFARKMRLDLDKCLSKLRQANIVVVNADQTLEEIAAVNGIIPRDIFKIIKVLPVKPDVRRFNSRNDPDNGEIMRKYRNRPKNSGGEFRGGKRNAGNN